MYEQAVTRCRSIVRDVDITLFDEFRSSEVFFRTVWMKFGLHDSVKRSKFKAKLHDRVPPAF